MNDKTKEQTRIEFEVKYPTPAGAMWNERAKCYVSTVRYAPNCPLALHNIRLETWQAAHEMYAPTEVDDFHSDARDAKRYRYIKENMEWRRSGGDLNEPDSHAFVGCRFPYLANFTCATMLDHNIDKMMTPKLRDYETGAG